jgi:exonuclease SbcC
LAALTVTAGAERVAVGAPLADARRLRTEIDGLQREYDVLGVTIEAAIRNIEERRTGLHAAQLKAKEHTVRGADIAERLGSIDREIAPFLAAADRTAEQLPIPRAWPLDSLRSPKSTMSCVSRLASSI